MVPAATRRTRKPRVLPPRPRLPRSGRTVVDARGIPVFGARQGAVEQMDWSRLGGEFRPGLLTRRLRHRRWVYVMAATDELLVALAVVDGGSTGTAFVMVTDLRTGQVLADSSRPGGAGPLVSVSSVVQNSRLASYRLPGTDYRIEAAEGSITVSVRLDELEPGLRLLPGITGVPIIRNLPTADSRRWLELDLVLQPTTAPPLTAVTKVDAEGGMVTATVKTAAMNTSGRVWINGAEHSLEGGLGGVDYSNGYLPRHTAWRWAYTTGRLADGRLFGLNLVSGFTGIGDAGHENCAWLDGALVPLPRAARLVFFKGDLTRPWTVRTLDGSVHLRFVPVALHRESLNVGVIRSRFVQPTGRFFGHVTVDGERVVVDGLPGVVEDQDILW